MLNFNNINFQDIIDDKNEEIEIVSTKDIAIIGIAIQAPMADNTDEFWYNLTNGIESITNFPENRGRDMDSYIKCMGINGGKVNYNLGGYLREIDKFDNKFFRISPKEASLMDPNHRLFLETTWKAIEDAGYSEDKIKGSRTGVYLGFNADTIFSYKRMISELEEESGEMAITGNLTSVISGRVSYLLDLKGPSLAVDTACSSSLVTLHIACRGIRNGDCDMAIAGSVKTNILPLERKQKLGVESWDSRTKAFDDDSEGTGMGEAVAVVLLKPLNKAIEDKDNIYAVIKGSAINQDGKSIGISAPNAVAQEDVIVNAWKDAGIDPETVSYIETHGTGTELGDPIEVDGIQRAFRRYTNRKQFCGIGSVKPNVGHLDNASGVVNLIKVALALKHKQIPASLNFNYPSRKINFEDSPVYVNNELREWESEGSPRRAGVSAFGISGTNAHIVLEEYQDNSSTLIKDDKYKILCLSAKNQNSLNDYINEYKEYLQDNEAVNIQHICYTANTGRGHYNYRLAIVGSNTKEILDSLSNIKLPLTKKTEIIDSNVFYNDINKENNLDSLSKTANTKIEELRNGGIIDIDLVKDVCTLYIQGANIEWEKLYEATEKQKVSVPTYPFERVRCWIDIPDGFESSNISQSNIRNKDKKQVEIELEGREDNKYSDTELQIARAWGEILGFRELRVSDSFYELGGDSIAAMKIVNKLNQSMNINIEVAELLKHQTIEAVAACLEDRLYTDAGLNQSIYSSIQPVEKKEYYSLSSAQKRLFILNQISEVGTSYNIADMIEIKGRVDKKRLEEAFAMLLQKHESLRTSFDIIEGEPVQRIHEAIEFEILQLKSDKDKLDDVIREFVKPFDFSKAPLIRAALIEAATDEHILVVDMHHIVSDGSSVGILIKDLVTMYDTGLTSALKIQYKDFAEWQKDILKSEHIKKQEEYWLNTFSGEIPVLNLPTDYVRPSTQSFEGASLRIQLNEITTKKLKNIASKTNTTLYALLLAVYNVLLSKYSGQEDIIVGTVIAGRPNVDLEKIIGMFVNTLAARNFPVGDKTFESFLTEVRDNSLEAFNNQDYQFEELIDKLNIARDFSRNPLFDTLFVMHNMDIPEVQIKDAIIRPYIFDTKATRFDLSLQAKEIGSCITLIFEYSTKLFKDETIQSLSKHFENIINVIINDTSIKLSDVEMLSEEEKHKVLVEFNDTKTEYPENKTIQQLFEEQVEKTSDNIAVVYKEEKLTYKELNEKANMLARVLKNKGIKPNEIVGIMVEYGTEMLVGILGILKTGAVYLPIDANYPKDRIDYMIKDSGVKILLTASKLAQSVSADIELIFLEDEELYKGDKSNLEIINTAKDTAYVIYTSGSTGKPKGVMIEHSSLVNLCKWHIEYYGVTENDNSTKYAGFGFDASVWEIFPYIIAGAAIHIIDEEIKLDVEKLNEYYNENKITISFLPTQICEQFMKQENKTLRYLLAGGDKLRHFEAKSYKVVNNYGPTENTVVTTSFIVDKEYDNIPIGRPIANSQVYILDKNNKLQAIGVSGELCITGAGIARGYLNNSELTAEKFVENPYIPGEIMYKTGDLVRWLPDGNIEFLGRIDNQVKIRGYRIELGEIENELRKHKDIKEAIVADKSDKNDNKYLCGYIVAERELTVEEIKEHLMKSLPDYMVPAYFVYLDKLPLTANGKVDRKALPEPDVSIGAGAEYTAPTNETEEILASIWEEVLGVENIGIDDNFFSLGGDSIKAIQVTSRLHKYNMKLDVKQMFQNQTISRISKYVEYSSIKSSQETVTGEVELTPIQKWFFERSFTDMHHWNQTVMLHAEKGFDESIINKVFTKIIEHHDALRAVFEVNGQEVKQVIKPINEHMYDFEVYDFRNISDYLESIKSKSSEVQASIDLEKGPLVKLALFNTTEGDYLLIVIHHLLVDGISWRVILEDFAMGYNQCMNNQNIELQLKTDSYKLWTEALNRYSSSNEIKKEIEYWTAIENSKVTPVSDTISNYLVSIEALKATNKLKDSKILTIELTAEQTEKLLKEVNSTYNTEINDILLSALGYSLREWTGSSSILIGLEGHGREEHVVNANIKRTVGWFTTMYPVILDMSKHDSLAYQIKSTKEALRKIPNKGIGYSILKYLTPVENRQKLSFSLTPEIGFNYLGQFEENRATDIFSMSGISSGDSMSLESERINLIDINGIIAQGKFMLNFSYSEKQLTKDGVMKLAEYYKTHLIKIIEHCINKDENELTASDITLKGVSVEEFDEIFDLFED
ncbi:MAG: amino acid adenylation domain-containing protein [Lutisporaceae bacterium]